MTANPHSWPAPPAFVPDGWPVVEPELLMGYIGSIMVIRMGGAMSSSVFSRYFEEWSRAIDARPEGAQVFVLYDLPEWPGMSGAQRTQWAELLKSRAETLRRTTSGVVIASPSTLARGGVQALFGMAPPPYPHAVVETPRDAFAFIAMRDGTPGDVAADAYEAFVRGHWRAAE